MSTCERKGAYACVIVTVTSSLTSWPLGQLVQREELMSDGELNTPQPTCAEAFSRAKRVSHIGAR
jgi:hypothetical protein